MRRFPLWLRAELLRARFAQSWRGSATRKLILRLDLDDDEGASRLASGGSSPETRIERDILGSVDASRAPVVWIGGSDPLAFPGVGQLARRIVDCGRTVFVETDGFYLRRRIHEFRPVSRLYLTPRFYGLQRSNDLRVGREGTFGRAIEGIRAAKLSGFLICGHVLVDAKSDLNKVAQLKELLLGMDADGLVVSSEPEALSSDKEALDQKLREARKMVESKGWGAFGRLLEHESSQIQTIKRNAGVTNRILQLAADQQQEGVEVR